MGKSGLPRTCPCPVVDIRYSKRLSRGQPVRWVCRFGCTRWGAHGQHLVDTTEQSVCSGDAALCQVSLTTYIGGTRSSTPTEVGAYA